MVESNGVKIVNTVIKIIEINMSKLIDISDETEKKLTAIMRGFDSYNDLIKFLINFYEYELGLDSYIEPSTSLIIEFLPENDEKIFKERLLKEKRAYVHLLLTNGITEIKEWNANKLTESSNIVGNLRSGPLRDWKKRGIVKAMISFSDIPF
jgi:hypothetical protein